MGVKTRRLSIKHPSVIQLDSQKFAQKEGRHYPGKPLFGMSSQDKTAPLVEQEETEAVVLSKNAKKRRLKKLQHEATKKEWRKNKKEKQKAARRRKLDDLKTQGRRLFNKSPEDV